MSKYQKCMNVPGILFAVLLFLSCSEKNLNAPTDEMTEENTIEFTVDATGEWRQYQLYFTGDRMLVDWGDGRSDEYTPADYTLGIPDYKHTYYKPGRYRVRILATEVTFLSLGDPLIPVSDLRLCVMPRMHDLALNSFSDTYTLDLNTACPNLSSLNLGSFPDLTELRINRCKQVKDLQIYNHPRLTRLDLEGLDQLRSLQLEWCESVEELSLRKLPALNTVDLVSNSSLSAIETDETAAGWRNLNVLGCAFRSLDFLKEACTQLSELNCSNNQLAELNLEGLELLGSLDCSQNRLTALLLPEKNVLEHLACDRNLLEADALNAVFGQLNDYTTGSKSNVSPPVIHRQTLSYYDNPGESTCRKEIPTEKGWFVESKSADAP